MKIRYLKILQDNRSAYPDRDYKATIEPMTINDIILLENLYNNGIEFPQVLRELLFLAGRDCYVLDYGFNDSIIEVQEFVRTKLKDFNQQFQRPFIAIDIYNSSDQFLFVYLDEGHNPPVYEAEYKYGIQGSGCLINKVSSSLLQYIDDLIARVKEGRNPF